MANEPTTKESVNWFRDTAQNLSGNYGQLMNDPKNGVGGLTIDSIGRMYMFFYDPKHKDTLPRYDTFPLVFPINFYGDGFLGINFHYLPPGGRVALLNALKDTASNDKYDDSTKLKISYSILNNVAGRSGFKDCVKRYLYSFVQSRYLYVEPRNWDFALNLPTESFVTKSQNIRGGR
jgi:hypothetical protein